MTAQVKFERHETVNVSLVRQGALSNQNKVPDGIYLITEEWYYMCEEDNIENLFISED